MEIKLLNKSVVGIFHNNTTIVVDFRDVDTPQGIQQSVNSLTTKINFDIYLGFVTDTSLLLKNKEAWIDLFNEYLKRGIILSVSECDVGKGHFIVSGQDCCNHIFFNIEIGHIRMGVFNKEPDNKYILDNSPLDILIGPGQVISKIYRDFDPFYIIVYDSWPQDSNLEISNVRTVKIPKLTGWSREGVIDLKAYKLKAD